MATVKQRKLKDGKTVWDCQVLLGTYPNGKRIYRSVSAKTRKQAENKAVVLKANYLKGDVPVSNRAEVPTLGDWMIEHSNIKLKNGEIKSKKTHVTELYNIGAYITKRNGANAELPNLSEIKLNKVTRADVQRLVDAMIDAEKPNGDRRLSNLLIKQVGVLIKQALNKAVTRGYINNNPVGGQVLDLPAEERSKNEFIGLKNMDLLLKSALNNLADCGDMVYIALMLGLRKAEIRGVKWEDFNLAEGTLIINENLVDAGTHGLISKGTKNKSSERILELENSIIEILKNRYLKRGEELLALGETIKKNDYIFSHIDGTPYGDRYMRTRLQKIIDDAGVPMKADWRILRHTHFTATGNATEEPIAETVRRGGWTSARMLTEVYYDNVKGNQRKTLNTLSEKLAKAV